MEVKSKTRNSQHRIMKVLVLSSLFPSPGSINNGIFIKEQLKEIKKLCSVIGVVSPKPWLSKIKDNPKEEEWGDIKIYRPRYFMIPKLTIYLNGFFYFISVYLFLRRMKRLVNIDIIHVHFAYPAGFAGVLLGKMFKKHVILTVRGTDINCFPQNSLLRIVIRYTLKNVNGIIAVSYALKKKVSNMGIEVNKIAVIPNGVNLNLFKPILKRVARMELGIDNNCKIILFVGNFEKVKGLEYLVRAFKEICYSNVINNTKLVLIGTGPLYDLIKKMIDDYGIKDRVILKNYIPHEEVPLWMNASDVFCLTSLNEGRPNVLYEAIACGIPVVATNVGGVAEIIISDELGALIPPKSAKDTKDALTRVLNKDWSSQSIRAYALPHSAAKYSKKVVDIYNKCFEPLWVQNYVNNIETDS